MVIAFYDAVESRQKRMFTQIGVDACPVYESNQYT